MYYKTTEFLWISTFTNIEIDSIAIPSLSTKLYNTIKQRKGKGGNSSKALYNQTFTIPKKTFSSDISSERSRIEVSKDSVIKELQEELNLVKHDLEVKTKDLKDLRAGKVSLKRKLFRAKNKVESAKKLKIELGKDTKEIQRLEKETMKLNAKLIKCTDEKSQLSESKREVTKKLTDVNLENKDLVNKYNEIAELLVEGNDFIQEEMQQINVILQENEDLKTDNDYLRGLLDDNKILKTWDSQKNAFLPEVTNCVMKELGRFIIQQCPTYNNERCSRRILNEINVYCQFIILTIWKHDSFCWRATTFIEKKW